MLRTFFISILLASVISAAAQQTFVHGADASWASEMEADGMKFYNDNGQETDIFQLMSDIGMTAVRLRVWVNPSVFGYGAWCDKADVVRKARRAHDKGLDLMIDFHYSDFFADPAKQNIPTDWKGYDMAKLKDAVRSHTTDVLQALKDEGITPRWVQVGNETNGGMLWNAGKIDWNKTGSNRYAAYVELHNTGYDAVKAIFRDAYVILHLADGYKAGDWDGWFFADFKNAGGKFDMIGLSHYPDYNQWSSKAAGTASNYNVANSVETLGKTFGVPVMICETGFRQSDAARAKRVMQDLMERLKASAHCAGVFYWEPETDGKWKPQYYYKVNWNAYDMGAFSEGRPTVALDAFRKNTQTAIEIVSMPADSYAGDEYIYNLQGQRMKSAPQHGVYIKNGKKIIQK